MNGHVSLHRKMFDNPVVCKDADHIAVWVYLLCHAVWKPVDVMFHGNKITLSPGQLTTGRKVIADKLKISESKVQRILKTFENEHQIEQQTDRQCRLITIVSWNKYQKSEQRSEQRVNNDRTTSEQRVNTKEEYKNNNNTNNYKSSSYKGPVDLTDLLSPEEIQSLFAIYADAGQLLDTVEDEVNKKRKTIDKPYEYVVGYAQNRGWPEK